MSAPRICGRGCWRFVTVEFSYRDVRVVQPGAGEVPAAIAPPRTPLAEVRVAKLGARVVGGYRLQDAGGGVFAIRALGVCSRWRQRGVGRWLLGHALGVAESRGGRVVEVPGPGFRAACGFFEKAGFQCQGDRLVLAVTPD